MRYAKALFLLGILVFLTPLIGLPATWFQTILMVVGGILVLFGILLHQYSIKEKQKKNHAPSLLPTD